MKQSIKIATNAQVEYSTVCPFSKLNTWLLLIHAHGFFGLYKSVSMTYGYSKPLPAIVSASSCPRWSRDSDNEFTFISGNALYKYDLISDTYTTIRIFDEYASINDGGEADVNSSDNRVLCGVRHDDGQNEVFVFDIEEKRKGLVFPQAPFDGLKLTAANDIILSRAGAGIFNLHTGTQLVPYDAHAALYQNTLLWARSDDKNAIMYGDRMLLDLGWSPLGGAESMAVNISTCDQPLCLVATYGKDKNVKYANQILMVPLDGLPMNVICDSPAILRSDESHPKVALSRDGSRAVFRVDDGTQIDTHLVLLGDSGVVTTPPPPFPVPGVKVKYSEFVGLKHWEMWPQLDDNLSIIEIKDKP